ncbi:MAG: tetraacyldisaccharide 4'-kinase [bacterium]
MKSNRFENIEKILVDLIQRKDTSRIKDRRILLLLWVLAQLSHGFKLAVRIRHALYNHGIARHHTLGCQVISIGNVTVGGTGKTPVVEVFARSLQKRGRKVAILSRGYRKKELPVLERLMNRLLMRNSRTPPRVVSDGRNLLLDSAMGGDEPYMLASNLADVAVLVDKDRVKSGRFAINHYGCDTLILDDGFQYLALKHHVEIVLVDSKNPFANGYMLPRGLLREDVKHLSKAHYIFITKCDGSDNSPLKAEIRKYNAKAEMIECTHRARFLKNVFTTTREDLDFLRGKTVAAVSGIAAPAGFERELEKLGAHLTQRVQFTDHHRYTQQEIIEVINSARESGAEAIITTEKDAVRFPRLDRCDLPVYFLRVDIELLSGTEDFNACIARICFQ